MKPYYYVYNWAGEKPRVRHATIEQAEKEACRLAKEQPGAFFEILQCLGVTGCSEPSTEWVTTFDAEPEKEPEPKYRMLRDDEEVKKRDEYFNESLNAWRPANRIGMKADSGVQYRRRLQ